MIVSSCLKSTSNHFLSGKPRKKARGYAHHLLSLSPSRTKYR
uniref:Uncharacterized protein n=1 Tax=Anopheles christyi TaxID=43041 RepID=A0A182KHN3_9DIPT